MENKNIIFLFQIVPERIDSRAKAPQQNVQPGTVVDKGVMNAALTEFLLVGHKALQVKAIRIKNREMIEFARSFFRRKIFFKLNFKADLGWVFLGLRLGIF